MKTEYRGIIYKSCQASVFFFGYGIRSHLGSRIIFALLSGAHIGATTQPDRVHSVMG